MYSRAERKAWVLARVAKKDRDLEPLTAARSPSAWRHSTQAAGIACKTLKLRLAYTSNTPSCVHGDAHAAASACHSVSQKFRRRDGCLNGWIGVMRRVDASAASARNVHFGQSPANERRANVSASHALLLPSAAETQGSGDNASAYRSHVMHVLCSFRRDAQGPVLARH